MFRPAFALLVSLWALQVLTGCAHRLAGPEVASHGRPSGGWLDHAVRLAPRGAGYEVLRQPAEGGQHWGTARMVALVQRAARSLGPEGAPLRVGDLSAARGGQIPHHRSHRNGRDADLLFFTRDEATGLPVPAPGFVRYDRDGRSIGRASPLRFDLARNWSLLASLLGDEHAGVARIFVADWLRRALLEHARAAGEPTWLIDRAERVLLQPRDSLAHDDHFHVRVACTAQERYRGCIDGAPLWPWLQKDWEKDDAVASDDQTLLDLMEPLETVPGDLHPAGTAQWCAPPLREAWRAEVCI